MEKKELNSNDVKHEDQVREIKPILVKDLEYIPEIKNSDAYTQLDKFNKKDLTDHPLLQTQKNSPNDFQQMKILNAAKRKTISLIDHNILSHSLLYLKKRRRSADVNIERKFKFKRPTINSLICKKLIKNQENVINSFYSQYSEEKEEELEINSNPDRKTTSDFGHEVENIKNVKRKSKESKKGVIFPINYALKKESKQLPNKFDIGFPQTANRSTKETTPNQNKKMSTNLNEFIVNFKKLIFRDRAVIQIEKESYAKDDFHTSNNESINSKQKLNRSVNAVNLNPHKQNGIGVPTKRTTKETIKTVLSRKKSVVKTPPFDQTTFNTLRKKSMEAPNFHRKNSFLQLKIQKIEKIFSEV